jgi:glutaredoxin
MTRHRNTAAALLIALTCALPAAAQYKVVEPDGKITYTDRPMPAAPGGQVQSMRRAAQPGTAAGPALPAELQAVAARFPVTLYTGTDCPPCDSGRQLLQQRGIPYTEHLVASNDDIAALQRLTGGRTVPALTVGGQALRGFQGDDWGGTLDLAGYPKESRLPRGWQPAPASPLVARNPVEPTIGARSAPVPEPAAIALPPASGIRF